MPNSNNTDPVTTTMVPCPLCQQPTQHRDLIPGELVSKNMNTEFDQHLTFGERVADKVAEFGGSWKFIILFSGIILGWIMLNTWIITTRPFDPYPYILLNLVLSCLAAVQAPIIMMSQNRQTKKDRMLADHDYRTNLKAELEVRELNQKLDHILAQHWKKLLEIQQLVADSKNKQT